MHTPIVGWLGKPTARLRPTRQWAPRRIAAAAAAAVTAGLFPAAPAAEAAFPGVNGKIAFVTDRDGNNEIYIMNPDGSEQTNLTNDPTHSDVTPVWSADGTKIAFARVFAGGADIMVMDADGGGVVNVTNTAGQGETEPAWSPDGTKIAYYWVGGLDIWVVDLTDGTRTNLTNATSGVSRQPVWSPDGTQIAYARSGDIWVMNADGSGQTNLTNTSGGGAANMEIWPDWAPDGTRIAFQRGADTWVMNPDGSGQTQLTSFALSPAWSPDGTKITFTRNVGQGYDVYVMNPDGTGATRLTDTSYSGHFTPDWQPLAVSPPPQVTVSIDDVTVTEGDTGTTDAVFTVTRSGPSDAPVTVDYATVDHSAVAGSDYLAVSGTLSMAAGQTTATIAVPVVGDTLDEADEIFFVDLSNPTGADVSDGRGTATILDDDEPPAGPALTEVGYTGTASVQYSDPAALSGTLLDTSASPPAGVAGRTLDFTVGSQSASAGPTDANGTAATSLVVTQQPGSVSTVVTSFAGDAAYAPSTDTDPFAVLAEDCSLAYTGDTLVSAGAATTLRAEMGEPDSSLGDRSGKTVAFHAEDAAGTATTVTAVTDAAGRAATTVSLPPGAYAVTTAFAGDAFYLPCAAPETLVTVEDTAAAEQKVTGGGFVVDGGRVSFGFNAASDSSGMRGQLQVNAHGARRSRFHGDTVAALTVSGTTATWSGTGRWNGAGGYRYEVSVADNRNGGSRRGTSPDTFAVTVRDGLGGVVFSASGALRGGNITVH